MTGNVTRGFGRGNVSDDSKISKAPDAFDAEASDEILCR